MFVASLVEKSSISLEMDDNSALWRREEKCQYSNALGYILQFVVLNKWIVGNPFVLFGITKLFRPMVVTRPMVEAK